MEYNYSLQKIYVLCFGGLALHLKTAFWESSRTFDSFSIKLLIWSMIPYLLIIILRKRIYGATCAAIIVFVFDLFVHLDVFVGDESSTSALGLLFVPLVNIVLFIPVSFLIGYFIQKRKDPSG